ncbi:MAG TPA: hypothetical protein VGX96_11940 [Candidatus Elarobacter sp.]|nr:hypothetical protein [Candidatus Elarobacter sp.]
MTTAGPPNDETVQLQTAMHNIDALHHTITQSLTGFDGLFAEHAQTGAGDQRVATAPGAAPETGALHDALTELHQLTAQITQELTQTFGSAVETLHQHTTQTQGSTQQHGHDWDQAHDGLKSALTALEQTATQAAAGAQHEFGTLQSTVEQVAQATQDHLHQFETTAQTFGHTLADTVTTSLNRAAGEFHDGITGAVTGKVTEHLGSMFQNAEQSLTDVAQTAEHVAQNFAHDAEDGLQHFSSAVVEGAKHQIEQSGEHLAKDAIEALGAIVATSIAEATAGSAITAAMSPILPEVIVVKEASEAIKDLISVFKTVGSIL